MKLETAVQLASELRDVPHTSATVVHFDERGGTHWEVPDEHDMPADDLYGVQFSAYDALIPQGVIEVVAEYDTQGIYLRPDPGVVCPREEV